MPGLFDALGRYSPGDGNDPLENFITEGFAWLLNKYPEFSEFFLRHLEEELRRKKQPRPLNVNNYDCDWSTQDNFAGKYPDMVCRFRDENKAIVFEHKVGSDLHENQLKDYRDYAQQEFDDSRIVLITATRQQHEQDPDHALCWSDIYKLISDWEQETNGNIFFLLKDFQKFLKNRDLGPPAPVSRAAIRYYCEARGMEQNLKKIIKRVIKREKREKKWRRMLREDYHLKEDNRSGRMGISLWGEGNEDEWFPNIFVGILLDGKNHSTKPIDSARGPDFCLILCFATHLHGTYKRNEHYRELLCNVQQKLNDESKGWKFYNHLEDRTVRNPNKWHPVHIRRPLLDVDVFAGIENEEQEERFYEAASFLIKLFGEEESFWKLRAYCKGQGKK